MARHFFRGALGGERQGPDLLRLSVLCEVAVDLRGADVVAGVIEEIPPQEFGIGRSRGSLETPLPLVECFLGVGGIPLHDVSLRRAQLCPGLVIFSLAAMEHENDQQPATQDGPRDRPELFLMGPYPLDVVFELLLREGRVFRWICRVIHMY